MKFINNSRLGVGRRLLALLLTVVLAVPAYTFSVSALEAETASTLYVSPQGSGTGNGTVDDPFSSIIAARNYIRENRENLAGGVTVIVAGGIYSATESIEFTAEDSATGDFPIVYKAEEGEIAVIDGGTVLPSDGFTAPAEGDPFVARIKDATARERVLTFSLDTLGIDYTSGSFAIFYDGNRGMLARYPNEQYVLGFNDTDHRDDPAYQYDNGEFYDKSNVVSTWASIEGVSIIGMFEIDWSQSKPAKLVNYNAETNRVKVDTTAISGPSGRYIYTNVVEEIDSVGEYYIDNTTGTLYFYAPENYRDIKIGVPACTGAVISVDGADGLVFDGFTVENGCGTLINIKADDTTVRNCTIRCGDTGLSTNGLRNTIYNNEVYRIGATAIIASGGDIKYLIPSDTIIDNNDIHDFGDVTRVYAGGLEINGVGFEVTHNEVYHAPHTGMQNLAMQMLVEYNYFHDLCYEAGDAGAIYDGTWRGNGNIFRNNVIANITNSTNEYYTPNGYYCDDGGGGKTFESNICVNIDGDAVFFGGGPANNVTDNIIVNSGIRYDQRAYYPGTGVNAGWTLTGAFVPNITSCGLNWKWMIIGIDSYATESWSMQFPWTMLLKTTNVVDMEDNFVSYAFVNAKIRNNVFAGTIVNDIQNNVQRLAIVRDNISGCKPEDIFEDYNGGDFTVREDSAIYHDLPGFKACDFSKVGMVKAD